MSRPTSWGTRASPSAARRVAFLALAAFALAAGGCRAYRARPLDEGRLLEQVRAQREAGADAGDLTLAQATAALRRNNPEIREALAAYQTSARVSQVRTPAANPSLSLGPLLFGGNLLNAGTWGLEAALGWTLPLASTRVLQDHVNAVQAQAAFARAGAVTRREYLRLRADYAQAGLAAIVLVAEQELGAAARASVEASERLVEAGQASAVEVALLRLDAARTEAEVLDAQETFAQRHEALAARVGLTAASVAVPGPARQPHLPPSVPDVAALEAEYVRSGPELGVRRAEYLVAEKELRLEIARQWPDLSLGLDYERQDGNRLGLPLGIEVPLFDRNQVGIARACAARDEARVRYRAELERGLAAIAGARALVEARARRLDRLQGLVGPEAERALATVRQALAAGTTDALAYLEVLRTTRAAVLETLRARVALLEAWAALEEACGFPLLAFPEEAAQAGGAVAPQAPAGAKEEE